jgi:beta-1,4-N-acetylglucosaminyltransferase
MSKTVGNAYSKIFVTVGTTDFDTLILKLDTPEFFDFIRNRRCDKLEIQYGRGFHVPAYLVGACKQHGIDFECFRFKDSLDSCIQYATLVICHAGMSYNQNVMALL